jgi:regulator of sirC expression with transglutaminase-like and TPR domain
MLETKEIKALVSLLDDEDKEVIHHVEEKIISMGDVMIPFLESEWEKSFHQNPLVQQRIEDLIHALQFSAVKNRLKIWLETEQENLLKGLWIIATYQYPDLDYRKIKKDVDKIYYEAWLSHRTYASPFDQIRNLNQIIFGKLNYTHTQDMYAVGNSMINMILESKKGNPIALCIIYMLVANRLKMPIFGVNLPNLFVLTYKNDDTQFYINAFNKGAVFSKSDIDTYLEKLKLPTESRFYQPCTHLEILQRVLRNLILSLENQGDNDKVKEVKEILELIAEEDDKKIS